MAELKARLAQRIDSSENWAKTDVENAGANLVLLGGEIGVEVLPDETKKIKIGDGISKWSELNYVNKTPAEIEILVADAKTMAEQNAKDYADELIANLNIPTGGAVYQVTDLKEITTAENGDIAIVSTSIAGDKVSRTAYVWDASLNEGAGDWVAFDGNYNASNVYLSGTVQLSGNYTNIGNITKASAAAVETYDWDGMSMQELLEKIMSQVLYPSKPTPSVSVSLTNAGAKEIGTTVTPSFTVTYKPGTYAYGSVTNANNNTGTYAAPSNVVITLNDGTTLTGTMNGTGSSNSTLNIKDDELVVDASTSYYGSEVICAYADGAIPYTNTKSEYADAQVTAGTATSDADTSKITSYRNGCFYGTVSTANFDPTKVTSAIIRGLSGKQGKNYASGDIKMTIPTGATAVLIACPADKTGPTYVVNTTVNAPMTSLYGEANVVATIDVGGADATIDNIGSYAASYNVWAFVPAEAYGSPADLTITLGA